MTAGISRLTDYSPRRMVLDNGLRLIFERRPGPGVVALELFADAGLLREAKPGLACLTGRLLEEGTVESDRARAGRSDRRRGGHTRERPDGKLASCLSRRSGPGD